MSSGIEVEAFEQVRLKLVERTEQGEPITEAELREELGIGHDDLTGVLTVLRERGDATNVAPAEWRAPYESEREEAAADDAATAALDHFDGKNGPAEEEDGAPASSRGEEPIERTPPPARDGRVIVAEAGNVTLTAKVLAAMDAETIGKLVKAGVEEASDASLPFIFRVEPSRANPA